MSKELGLPGGGEVEIHCRTGLVLCGLGEESQSPL